MTFEDSHEQVRTKMQELIDDLERHEMFCRGVRMNLDQEMSSTPPAIKEPVEAASRLRELIGLK